MGAWVNGSWCWDLLWKRRVFAWEEELIWRLETKIQGFSLRLTQRDLWWWGESSSGFYMVSDAYIEWSYPRGSNYVRTKLWECCGKGEHHQGLVTCMESVGFFNSFLMWSKGPNEKTCMFHLFKWRGVKLEREIKWKRLICMWFSYTY